MICRHCEEPIEPGDLARFLQMHNDCSIRIVVGAPQCAQRRCERFVQGGPACGDDPTLTPRQAAKLAADAYFQRTES